MGAFSRTEVSMTSASNPADARGAARATELSFRLLVEAVKDHAMGATFSFTLPRPTSR